MYGEETPLEKAARWLRWSFPLGRAFGIEVRVYGTVVLVALFTLYELARGGSTGLGTAALLTLAVVLGLYVVIWTHEMGHALAGRRYRTFTERITLSIFGGLAHMDSPAPSPRAEALIAVAGPATHLAWLSVLWPLSAWLGDPPWDSGLFGNYSRWFVLNLRHLNLALMLFNLLPCYPMDGGRILRAILAMRMHANRATMWAARAGMLGAIGFLAWGMSRGALEGGILMGIAISNFFACRGALMLARYSDGPYGEPRDPWAIDPEAWRRGGEPDPADRGPRLRTGVLARWKARRAAVARQRERAAVPPPDFLPRRDPADDAELDRLLARVSEVGISGLTESERRSLTRLSESRRRAQ